MTRPYYLISIQEEHSLHIYPIIKFNRFTITYTHLYTGTKH